MAAIIGLCVCSSLSAVGGWFGGFIPGTEPHFLKEMNTAEWKKVVDDLKVRVEKRNEDMGEMTEKAGPDLSGLPAEERVEFMMMAKNHVQELRESETCEKAKELLDGNKYKDTLSAYPDDIFTFSGSKRKVDVLESAIGLDDDFPKREFDGALEVCAATDEAFEEVLNRFN
jgi:hypothetical protein